MTRSAQSVGAPTGTVESAYAWLRLLTAMLLGTIGGVGMWSFVVQLPVVQADLGIARADASLPYTTGMLGFAAGAVAIGRLVDRFGVIAPLVLSTLLLCVAYIGSAFAANIWQLAIAHGCIGLGSSATFAPLIADISHWFARRRGLAVSICATGSYLAGTLWPPIVNQFVASDGWRQTQVGIGLFCLISMLPLITLLKPRIALSEAATDADRGTARNSLGLSPAVLQTLILVAGLACCVAMSMPQVHIVAYCGDLGYGVARGAEMLSVMLGFGIISRVGSGFIADRIGGLATMLLGSALQASALLLYLWFDGLTSLYVISAFFGLVQGGIIPMYAVIVRDFFAPQEAGTRVGLAVMATIVGMAFGGWLSGAIFDLTGSYAQAFSNGIAWNLLNVSIVGFLMLRQAGRRQIAAAT
ncbi:MAG TPA: MFS transporter [Hyphomicrobiaceae bacterium]|jgi:MFS family permease|nr:MFS transporter [Hyphomicrobiaceae bacterium]